MDIRIGITQSPREISLEMDDDATKRDALKAWTIFLAIVAFALSDRKSVV